MPALIINIVPLVTAIIGASLSVGKPSNHSTRKIRLIETIPAPHTCASWRSTNRIGPARRRSAQKSAAQPQSPTVKINTYGQCAVTPARYSPLVVPKKTKSAILW